MFFFGKKNQKTIIMFALIATFVPYAALATTWYVSGSGNDKHAGTSAATAFRHLQAAAHATHPGDTVLVLNGTYTPQCTGCDVVDITTSGTATAAITYEAAPGNNPVLSTKNGWAGFHIDAAYITISGFNVGGNEAGVTYTYAYNNRNNLSNYKTSANGIIVSNDLTGQTSHHITIINNIVHDQPGAGIATCYADYITITGNTTYNNAFWSPYANSGISIWEMRDIDNNTGYKNYIENNLSYSNQEYIPFYETGTITDGNGIIVNDNKNTQSNNVPYGGRTLVANNISYLNGGSGIHTYSSQHVDIVGNTAYENNQSPKINEGQIFANSAGDVNILDNIATAPANKVFYSNYNNATAGVVYNYNVLYSSTIGAGLGGSPVGPNDIVANPLLANPAGGNFNLAAGSPAIGSATLSLLPPTDFAGNPRPTPGDGYDRGALQYVQQ